MPGTTTTTVTKQSAHWSVEPWHQAARVVCEVIDGIGELADILQGHPELRFDCADLETAHQALGRIMAVLRQRAAP